MSGTPERAAPTRLGRFGRPVRNGLRVTLGCLALAGLLVFVWHRGGPLVEPPPGAPEGGPDTIAATGQVSFLTLAPPTPPPAAGPQAGQPVMPQNIALPGAPEAPKPRRVVSFAPVRQAADAAAPPAIGAAPSSTAVAPTAASGGQPLGRAAGGATGQADLPGQPGGAAAATQVAFPAATMPGLRAGPAFDTTLTMLPGLYAMVLDSPINSEREGAFFAHLPRPVLSPAGVVLMEKDSAIWGTYKSEVSPGQGRVVTAAAWGMTPQGVPVPLGGAAVADGSGRVGMPGEINTHFWPRFGGALTLMVTQGAFQAASAALQAALSRGSANTFFNLNTGGIDAAVAAAVRAGTAVQNTIDVPAGQEVAFMLTTPISFADAYRLAPTGGRRR